MLCRGSLSKMLGGIGYHMSRGYEVAILTLAMSTGIANECIARKDYHLESPLVSSKGVSA